MPRRIGRFEIRGLLGRGAQASVWLGWDPTLQREVAVKLLSPGDDELALDGWLAEARAMSSLSHPGIVAVHEAQREGDRAYLVLERVDGQSLGDRLRERGAAPARLAVQWMQEVLDALASAHARGVVHRDLKPSNILIGRDDRARVMDFGIAARMAESHDGRIVGTPGYISPEAASGAPPAPSMDIFAAGLLLGQMLLGAPLRHPVDAVAAVRQAVDEDVSWPDPLPASVELDDRLRTIVLRATARQPAARFESAAAFREALVAWLHPATSGSSHSAHGTLEFLLRRMRLSGDFPALSDSVLRIHRVASSESESLQSLASEILRDVGLTHKLLRMVNTVRFHRADQGQISTVSRAAALVGFAGIRNMAMSLLLLEHMRDKHHAQRMKELFLEAMLTATLTDRLSSPGAEREEAFLVGLMSQLGRMLTQYYFPEEAQRIRAQCRQAQDEPAAVLEVLGMSFEALALGVAQAWALPTSLCLAMQPPQGEVPQRRLPEGPERLRWAVRASSELVQVLLSHRPEDALTEARVVAQRYHQALDRSVDDVLQAAELARAQWVELARSLQLSPSTGGRAARLMGETVTPVDTTLTSIDPARAEQMRDMLSAGIADVTHTLAGDPVNLNEVLRMILETLLRALHLQQVVFCLRDPRSQHLTGRFGLGEGAQELAKRFVVELHGHAHPDVFASACLRGSDTLLVEARSAEWLSRLPPWFRAQAPRSCLALPLMMKGAPFALIYASRSKPIQLGEREWSLLRTLRNQAVMAFKTVT